MFGKKNVITLEKVKESLAKNRDKVKTEFNEKFSIFQNNELYYQMNNIGFRNVPEIKDYINQSFSNRGLVEIVELFEYYENKYLNSLFVTGGVLELTCDELGLYFGQNDYYNKSIPLKNMEEIINFQLDDLDILYAIRIKKKDKLTGEPSESNDNVYNLLNLEQKNNIISNFRKNKLDEDYILICEERRSFYVLAPKCYFLENAPIYGNRIGGFKCYDPVVFMECRGGFIKVTEFDLI